MSGKAILDVYIDKQARYTRAQEERRKLTESARADINTTYKTSTQQNEAFNVWLSTHRDMLTNMVDGPYKDWVVSGEKRLVEHWFSFVDDE